ncbi:MAG: hypothetical protein ACRD4Y_10525 [Candidatus Acidiferrales bacterium]
MYLKCAHPECTSDFDSGQGRLFRFHKNPLQDQQPSHWHSMKHFWLCSGCCETFTIGYRKGLGVVLIDRIEGFLGAPGSQFVLQPDTPAAPPLPRRRARAAVRKRKAKLPPVQAGAIEILENRNLERRG